MESIIKVFVFNVSPLIWSPVSASLILTNGTGSNYKIFVIIFIVVFGDTFGDSRITHAPQALHLHNN